MCKSPFFLYVTVATCLNVPPAIYSLISILEQHDKDNESSDEFSSCQGKVWLSINLVFCVLNVIAAWYLYCKVRRSFGYDDTEFQNRHTAYSRASYILCYDPIVSGYILTLMVFFIWQCIGVVWVLGSSGECPDFIFSPFASSLGFGWAFLFGGSCAFCCSLCCTGCDSRDDYGSRKNSQQQIPAHTTTNSNQHQPPDTLPASTSQPTSVYIPGPVVTGLSSPTKSEAVPQRLHTNNPDRPYNEIPIAIAVPLPLPTKGEP